MKPEVLVLDEPTAGLDPMGRDEILDQIAAIQKERKITVILVSHSMEDVAKYVDRLIVMDHGSVQWQRSQQRLADFFQSPRQQDFVKSLRTLKDLTQKKLQKR